MSPNETDQTPNDLTTGECDFDQLDALVSDDSGDDHPELRAHVASCAACTDELKWRRQERALMAARRVVKEPVPAAVWQAVEARIANQAAPAARRSVASLADARERRLAKISRVSTVVYGVAAAAGLLFMLRGPLGLSTHPAQLLPSASPTPAVAVGGQGAKRKKVSADVAMADAQREYENAVAVLEAEYRQERGLLPPATAERYDHSFRKSRNAVTEAREALQTGGAGHDLDARISLLDGYADYAHSLQTVVTDLRSRRH